MQNRQAGHGMKLGGAGKLAVRDFQRESEYSQSIRESNYNKYRHGESEYGKSLRMDTNKDITDTVMEESVDYEDDSNRGTELFGDNDLSMNKEYR